MSSKLALNGDIKIDVCVMICVRRWADIGWPCMGSNLRH